MSCYIHCKWQFKTNIFTKLLSTVVSFIAFGYCLFRLWTDAITYGTMSLFLTERSKLSSAFSSLVGIGLQAANIRPTLEQVKPIMEAVPEISEDKKVVTQVSGGIELNNVSFRYNESTPWVLDNLSLKIKPGQYVAIVGKTGCGKSTLLRLLLGFETAQKGAVYYDGKNIDTLDLKSLRKKIGVVMQNGKLFHGDIFSNITIAAPWLTLGDAWEAAELAEEKARNSRSFCSVSRTVKTSIWKMT